MTKLPWALLAITQIIELAFNSPVLTGIFLTITIFFGAIATLNMIKDGQS